MGISAMIQIRIVALRCGLTTAVILSQAFRRSRRGVTSNPMPASKNKRNKIRSG